MISIHIYIYEMNRGLSNITRFRARLVAKGVEQYNYDSLWFCRGYWLQLNLSYETQQIPKRYVSRLAFAFAQSIEAGC